MPGEIDLRQAVNAISDVIQNRPRPLREFDQIYMKAGDMVLQSEWVAKWAKGKKLAFIGDGDAISVCVAYLHALEILDYGPAEIHLFDFDERICNAVNRFAEQEELPNLGATLYNCIDAFPRIGEFEFFYTNPPWGASNAGESVKVFSQRGMEAIGYRGEGMIVIADDPHIDWPQEVLGETQKFTLESRFFVQRMMQQVHYYHLDDAPALRSCNLVVKSLPSAVVPGPTLPVDQERLEHFYGKGNHLRVHYVRDRSQSDDWQAKEEDYKLEMFDR